MMKTFLSLIGTLSLMLATSSSVMAEYTYVQDMTIGSQSTDNSLTTWLNSAPTSEDLVDAITGAPDYVPNTPNGEALGWRQGYGNYTLDFGQIFEGDDVEITFWHFGGKNHSGVANSLIYMYASEDGIAWTPSYTQGVAGATQLEDVTPGGQTVFETVYNLSETFGLDSFRYLMIEKISGGPQTGKFIDAVGVTTASVPEPSSIVLLLTLATSFLYRRH